MDSINAALRCPLPEPQFGYGAPLCVHENDFACLCLKKFSENIPSRKPNKAGLYVEFAGGQRVRVYGADYYDRMWSIYFDSVVLDESANFRAGAWLAIARSTSPLAC
jgi:hypothetical protein